MFGEAAEHLARWRRDPVAFVREVIGAEPDAWQIIILRACLTNIRIALKASKGPGKSTVLSWIAWWFLVTRPNVNGAATSISGDNLQDGLWKELAKWRAGSDLLKATFKITGDRITAYEHPETWWLSARTWSKEANRDKQNATLAGLHGDNCIGLVDEAGEVPDGIVAAAEGMLANISKEHGREALLVLSGNPTSTSGPLYRVCTTSRHLWFVYEISGDPDDPNRAPRVDVQWARDQIEQYGRDSAFVLVNVFGRFPPGQADTLIAIDDAVAASKRTLARLEWEDHPIVLGIDVAFEGDDRTVFYARQGFMSWAPKTFRNLRTGEITGQALQTIESLRPDAVFVDCTGGYGDGVRSGIADSGYRAVQGINSSWKSPVPLLLNQRVYQWQKMADWIIAGGCLAEDPELLQELAAVKCWVPSDGKKHLEDKRDIKKRIGKSPDYADALSLTFARPVKKLDPLEALARSFKPASNEYDPLDPERRD